MDCSVFRKRLDDYIQGCISYDLKIAMDKHIDRCESCRDLYLTELYVDKTLKESMENIEIEFSSIAGEVMLNIDKNQYSKSPVNKAYYNVKKNSGRYSAVAAALIACIIMAPFIISQMNSYNGRQNTSNFVAKDSVQKKNSIQDIAPAAQYNSAAKVAPATKAAPDTTLSDRTFTEGSLNSAQSAAFVPIMSKKVINEAPKFSTSWKNSVSGSYAACVEGIGSEAQEQGMSKIIVKDLNGKEMWAYEITEESNTRLNTPKDIEWWDDSNLLVILGYSQGRIPGGDLYIMNIHTNEIKPLYEVNTMFRTIVKVTKVNSDIQLNLEIYDDTWNKYYTDQWIIKNFNLTATKPIDLMDIDGKKIDAIDFDSGK